jgi:hypothetical protein
MTYRYCNALDTHQQLIQMRFWVYVQWLKVGRFMISGVHALLVGQSPPLLFDSPRSALG